MRTTHWPLFGKLGTCQLTYVPAGDQSIQVMGLLLGAYRLWAPEAPPVEFPERILPKERMKDIIVIELLTSDRELKASREGSK